MKGLKYTTDAYIKICKENHPNCDYDYSKTEYTGSLNDVCVICPKHGEFYQSAYRHCKQNNIKLIEIPYWDINNIDTILSKELDGIIK